MLDINNIYVTFSDGTCALENITLSLPSHCICGVVGMNGAGKSTLFNSIMGLLNPQKGTISINNLSIKQALKQNTIAYVPQNSNIDWNFPVLVEDVVMMGRYGYMGLMRRPKVQDKKAVDEALERVNLSDLRYRQISELSGGQKKRMFVARALAHNGSIILLDEPFNGIDINTEENLVTLFKSLAKNGKLILVSTHNLGSVPHFCDQVILINRHLIATGPVSKVFTAENLSRSFGGMLRHLNVSSTQLHKDTDGRSVTVLSDDEHPLVLYGKDQDAEIIHRNKS